MGSLLSSLRGLPELPQTLNVELLLVSDVDVLSPCCSCREKEGVLKCSGCKAVAYCGEECQKKGWSQHKDVCYEIKQLLQQTTEAIEDLAKVYGGVEALLESPLVKDGLFRFRILCRLDKDPMGFSLDNSDSKSEKYDRARWKLINTQYDPMDFTFYNSLPTKIEKYDSARWKLIFTYARCGKEASSKLAFRLAAENLLHMLRLCRYGNWIRWSNGLREYVPAFTWHTFCGWMVAGDMDQEALNFLGQAPSRVASFIDASFQYLDLSEQEDIEGLSLVSRVKAEDREEGGNHIRFKIHHLMLIALIKLKRIKALSVLRKGSEERWKTFLEVTQSRSGESCSMMLNDDVLEKLKGLVVDKAIDERIDSITNQVNDLLIEVNDENPKVIPGVLDKQYVDGFKFSTGFAVRKYGHAWHIDNDCTRALRLFLETGNIMEAEDDTSPETEIAKEDRGGGGAWHLTQGSGTSTVELSITCKDLADKSDPFCVVYIKELDVGSDKYISVGKTETILNTLNPAWQTKFELSYKFESRQLIKFEVYDCDNSNSSNLEDDDFLGSCECSLGEIVSAQGRGLTRSLVGVGGMASNKNQSITLSAQEIVASRESLKLNLSGLELDNKNWIGRSDPFITVSKSGENGVFTVVHRTEVVKYNLNPDWKTFTLPLKTLCNGDHETTLKIQVDDWNQSGNHFHIGEFQTSVKALLEQGRGAKIPLINEKKRASHKNFAGYKNSGHIVINDIALEENPHTFLDFISGGNEISFTVAVDFTESNGNPREPQSLHYNDPTGHPNQYVTAIKSVGDIVQDYDSDKMFPALGFGARIPPDGRVSHEFFLNMQNDPYCAGIDGMLAAYYQALKNIQLDGPTNFAPVINHVANFARANQNDPTKYFVLLIITDGVITDLDATKRAVIEASSLPMSIIIIGVGSEDFKAMDELDSDEKLLSIGEHTAQRDIVQFVEMKKFVSSYGASAGWNKEFLARELLLEIPNQVLGYMKLKNFRPGKKIM